MTADPLRPARSWGLAAPSLGAQVGVVAVCLLATMAEGYDIQAAAFVAPILTRDWLMSPSAMGLLLTASVTGIVAGSAFLAPMGDRLGRRISIASGLAFAGAFTLAAAWSPDPLVLGGLRLAAGLGLGAAIPNLIVLVQEHLPEPRRMLGIVFVLCGFPLGAAAGGAAAARLIGGYGPMAVFGLGGVATLAMGICAFLLTPESPAFERTAPAMRASGGPGRFAALFNDGRGSATSLLWATFFCNMAMMYFFISWLPSLFAAEGLSPVRAIAATSVFNAGGVMGGLGMALMARRTPATAVLAGGYLLAAASIVTLAGGAAGTLLSYMAFGAGVGVVGGQFLLNGLVAQFYPAEIRATGLGVASGVGRMGAVLAPFAGGLLMTAHPQISDAFMMTAALALLAALAVVLAGRAQRQVRPEPSVVHPMNL